jgi:hypothetical protein
MEEAARVQAEFNSSAQDGEDGVNELQSMEKMFEDQAGSMEFANADGNSMNSEEDSMIKAELAN